VNTLLTVVILQTFHQPPGVIGIVDALATVGVICGAAAFKRTSRLFPPKRLALFGFLVSAGLISVEAVNVVALMIAIPISGFCFSQARVAARTMLMRAVPESRAGRVFGTTNAFGLAFSVAATMVLSVLADHTEVRAGFWGLSIVVGVTAIVAVLSLANRFVVADRLEPAPVPAESTP
jgi:MFS-type transporter involved in bile tolerance (Atg22 family)